MEKERELIAEYGRKMSAALLSRGTSGNISIYDPRLGTMAISPSGLDYFDTEPGDVCVCTLDGETVDSQRKPSSEYGLHAAFYKAKADQGCLSIVHTHSDYATTLACMGEPIRAVHFLIASLGLHEIPVAPYTTFGTPQLAACAVETCREGRAVLLANHGVVTFAPDLAGAFEQAENIEFLARTQWQCMCAGRMNVLSAEQIDAALARFRTYGQGTAASGREDSY